MAGLNKIMVIGNVGTDPEMRYTPNGSPVTSFRIARAAVTTVKTVNAGRKLNGSPWSRGAALLNRSTST